MASDLPPPARHLLHVLSATADWPSGVVPVQYSPSLTKLGEMTGLSRRSVMNHLNALEKSAEQEGWVIRSRPEVEKARSEKERTSYRLGVPSRARVALEARAGDALARAGDALELGQLVTEARAPVAPYQPTTNTSSKPTAATPAQMLTDATGATEDEAAAVIARIRNEREPRNLVGLLRRMIADGDIATLLTEHRAAIIKTRIAEQIAELRRKPECEHRMPGGDQPHPTSGQPLCPLCRAATRWVKAQPRTVHTAAREAN